MAPQVRLQISLLLVLGTLGCSTPRGTSVGITQILEQADEYYDPVPGPGDFTDAAPSHPQVREELRHVQMLWPLQALRITSAFGGAGVNAMPASISERARARLFLLR